MAELLDLRQDLDAAGQRINSGVPGDTRRSIESAIKRIQTVLDAACRKFLEGNGHPPPDLANSTNVICLIKREFRPNRSLALKVANTIGVLSRRERSTIENLSPPPVDLVRTWLALAYSWLDILEPILARRRQRAVVAGE